MTAAMNEKQLITEPPVISRTQIKIGSLFSAIGGFSKAFEDAGASELWANEKDRFAVDTFRLNFPNVRCIHKPVEELGVIKDKLEPVHILTAGFPCQPFSVAGDKRGFDDERGMLFMHIIRIIREFKSNRPWMLLLENVKNFRTHDKGRTFKRVQAEIQKAGYWFGEKNAAVLNSATHSTIPQNRERVFMVAMCRNRFSANTFRFPEALPPNSMRSVKALLDITHKAPDEFYFQQTNQYYKLFASAMKDAEAGDIFQLRRNYVRKNMSGLCFTLMANMGEGGHNEPVIKDRWGIRKLTPRECARLQGYDDSFQFPDGMSRTQLGKQIGNSVTVPLVRRIAENMLIQIETAISVKANQ